VETTTKSTITLFDRENSQLQKATFQCSHHLAFWLAVNKSLHPMIISICTSCHCHCCWKAPPAALLWWDPLFGLHEFSASINECQWVPFFCLCFICTPISDAILSDCPSAAVCHTATTCNRMLVGRFNLYCHPTIIILCCCGPAIQNKKHYFQSSPHNYT